MFKNVIFLSLFLASCASGGGGDSSGGSGSGSTTETPSVHVENQAVKEVGSEKYQGIMLFNGGVAMSGVLQSDKYIMVDPALARVQNSK